MKNIFKISVVVVFLIASSFTKSSADEKNLDIVSSIKKQLEDLNENEALKVSFDKGEPIYSVINLLETAPPCGPGSTIACEAVGAAFGACLDGVVMSGSGFIVYQCSPNWCVCLL